MLYMHDKSKNPSAIYLLVLLNHTTLLPLLEISRMNLGAG